MLSSKAVSGGYKKLRFCGYIIYKNLSKHYQAHTLTNKTKVHIKYKLLVRNMHIAQAEHSGLTHRETQKACNDLYKMYKLLRMETEAAFFRDHPTAHLNRIRKDGAANSTAVIFDATVQWLMRGCSCLCGLVRLASPKSYELIKKYI